MDTPFLGDSPRVLHQGVVEHQVVTVLLFPEILCRKFGSSLKRWDVTGHGRWGLPWPWEYPKIMDSSSGKILRTWMTWGYPHFRKPSDGILPLFIAALFWGLDWHHESAGWRCWSGILSHCPSAFSPRQWPEQREQEMATSNMTIKSKHQV